MSRQCDHQVVHDEVPLLGGNVSGEVVRVGDTVRKPWTASSDSVGHLLVYLEKCHFHGAPTSFGRDGKGRQTLEYIPGQVVQDLPVLYVEALSRVGGLIRELHALTAAYEPPLHARWNVILTPDREELVCHNDLGPWNLVIGGDLDHHATPREPAALRGISEPVTPSAITRSRRAG